MDRWHFSSQCYDLNFFFFLECIQIYQTIQVCSTGGEKFSLSIKIPCGTAKREPGKPNDGLNAKKFVVEQVHKFPPSSRFAKN